MNLTTKQIASIQTARRSMDKVKMELVDALRTRYPDVSVGIVPEHEDADQDFVRHAATVLDDVNHQLALLVLKATLGVEPP